MPLVDGGFVLLYACVCVGMCVHACVCVYVCVYICVCMCVYRHVTHSWGIDAKDSRFQGFVSNATP